MIKEVAPISEQEFESNLRNSINLIYFDCVRRFRSVKRAFKRGHITNYGYIIPSRPFNNKKHSRGRKANLLKKRAFEQITGKRVLW